MLETTETLLKGLAEGNEGRWARFYRDYVPCIKDILCARGLSPQDAEEVIHDTLVALAKLMPGYKYDKKKNGPFHSYILTIAWHKAVDRIRRNAAYSAVLARFADEPLAMDDADWRKTTLDIALARVFANPAFSETTRLAFRRHVQLGEDAATVAKDLGITVNNLYQIKSRVKSALADEVAKLREED